MASVCEDGGFFFWGNNLFNLERMCIFVLEEDEDMAYTRFEQSEEFQREELIRKIEATVKNMSLRELEALYYELSTKSFANDNIAL